MRFAVGFFASPAGQVSGMAFFRFALSRRTWLLFITLQAVFRWGGLLRPACSVMGFGQVDGMALRLPGATLLGD
ncbi:hypothetical protein, partial [Prauserella rugosa]|uniref:hypothetical protein n=1 Tax=Prauserella rugosa TaxID=43354 RepID=UPI001B800356